MPDFPVTVYSRRFGDLVLRPEDLIDFPQGLVGLGGCRYVVVRTDADSPVCWLQSAEDPDLALPITDPWTFFPEYVLELSDAVTADAALPDEAGDVAVWVTVRAAADRRDFSANLRAPIVVHAGRGHQVLNESPDAPVRAPLFDEPERRAA